jgi:two-component system response regulator RegA
MEENRILLIDDDEAFTHAMSRGFTRLGYEVRACHNAEDALAVCLEFKPTHILLDLNMPGTSGLIALPQLVERAPLARLVVLTGYSSVATAVEATKQGATNYLCKPARIDEIVAAFGDEVVESADVPAQPTSLNRLEWEHLQRVLLENDGNISATARALGMHRRTLQRKLQKRPVRH